ncbi:hypothetical protein BGZ76_011649 [Entomortierella beljakovae]|nr:hypothetical protein BGZ76_011649 [Entomortierella beljakovae]
MSTSENNSSPSQIVDRTLNKFGLKLVVPFESSGIALLQTIYDNVNGNDQQNIGSSSIRTAQAMSIDYSKILSTLVTKSWPLFRRYYLVRLSELPNGMSIINNSEDQEVEEEDDEGDNDDGSRDDNDAPQNSRNTITSTKSEGSNHVASITDMEHPRSTRVETKYLGEIRIAITQMWVHYNHENISALSVEIYKIAKLIPYAAKLVNLQSLYLIRSSDPVYPFVSDVVSFITQNKSASPRGKSLNLEFYGQWGENLANSYFSISNMDLDSYLSRGALLRKRQNLELESVIRILDAVKRPKTLRIHSLANFFNLADNIETDLLVELHDMDVERFEMGERGAMEDFLRSCSNLKVLRLAITHHESFQWTTNVKPLMRLEELHISSSRVYHAAIKAFNDAMTAFAPSMRKATFVHRHLVTLLPNGAKNAYVLRSLELQGLTLANTVGSFSVLLPHLRSLIIVLESVACINIGSLKNCPNLEELMIDFGPTRDDQIRPQGEVPTQIPDFTELLDPNWSQTAIDYSLFPAWDLPRLKYLRLEKMAAMRFNFASLPTMRRLKALKLKVQSCGSIYDDKGYILRQQKVPPCPTSTTTPNYDFSEGYGVFGSYMHQKWTLPVLESISIRGPPSEIFCMEYLRNFPLLKTIKLWNCGTRSKFYRNPVPVLFDSEGNRPNFFNYTGKLNDIPLMESQIREFRLVGNWELMRLDLKSLLTIYTPFVEKFEMDQPFINGTRDAISLIRVLHAIDTNEDISSDVEPSSNDEGSKEDEGSKKVEESKMVGGLKKVEGLMKAERLKSKMKLRAESLTVRNLLEVKTGCYLNPQQKEQLGLVDLKPTDMEGFLEHRKRIYYLSNETVVSKSDCHSSSKEKKIQVEDERDKKYGRSFQH